LQNAELDHPHTAWAERELHANGSGAGKELATTSVERGHEDAEQGANERLWATDGLVTAEKGSPK
jgi:hypothetical protein